MALIKCRNVQTKQATYLDRESNMASYNDTQRYALANAISLTE